MPAPQYVCSSEGAVTLVAATPKTVVGAIAHANSGLMVVGFSISFADTNATEAPALVELMLSSAAGAGTSTGTTPRQTMGRVMTAGFTSAKNYTVEPTALTLAFPEFVLTPNGGTFIYNFPLGCEPDCDLAKAFMLRVTAPSAADCRAALVVSRI